MVLLVPVSIVEFLGSGERSLLSLRTGEFGRLLRGDPGKVDPTLGVSVKRNNFADNCQKVLWEMNISDHPSGVFSSGSKPVEESSDVTKPIRSSFCIRFRPLSTPSLLMFMRHSPLGLPKSGVFFEASVVRNGEGVVWWKYQYKDAQSIIAICLVGLVGALKSWLEGFEMEDMKRLSFCKVGFLYGWICRFLALGIPLSSFASSSSSPSLCPSE